MPKPGSRQRISPSGHPLVLTINGKAEFVVQEAASHQKLLDRIDELQALEGTQRGLAGVAAGTRKTRPISWIKAALKDFRGFPGEAQMICLDALTIAAEGGKADIAKPLQGLGSGVMGIALPFDGNAYRVVYALQNSPT